MWIKVILTVYTLTLIPLSGTIVEQVYAADADTGVNAEISYRIQKGGFDDFYIDPKTGEITVKSETKLDYDRRKEYNIEVRIVYQSHISHHCIL